MDRVHESITKLNSIISSLRQDISQHNILEHESFETDLASYIISYNNPNAPTIDTLYNDIKRKYVSVDLKQQIDIDFDALNRYHHVQIDPNQVSYAALEKGFANGIPSAYINGMNKPFPEPIYSISDIENYLISDIESFRPILRRYNVAMHPHMYKGSLDEYAVNAFTPLTNGVFAEYVLFLDEIPEKVFTPKMIQYELKHTTCLTIYTFL